jgi:Putative Flp pilus-assembly TadE/G-like
MLALCLIALFGFVGLAVDLGMLAIARTECQNAADAAALTGCRTLNNKVGSINSNLSQAVSFAKTTATTNDDMKVNFTTSQIQKVETGQYLYNATTGVFGVSTWTDVTNSQSAAPTSGSWTAIRVTMSVAQRTYFMKVFGVTSMPTGAIATAVYRPRDVAFVLDMTGSMAYASTFNYSGSSLNPDNLYMVAGHYVGTTSNLIASANLATSTGEVISLNNYTISTPGGPPIVRDFYYDSSNVASPATPAYPVTVANLGNAFHNIPASAETPGNSSVYQPSTYNFAAYNAFDTTRTNGPTPAPGSFGSMTDSGTILYVGDRWRRADGSINKTDTTWATGSVTTRGAANAIELLGYNVSGTNVRGGTSGTTTITTTDKFRDLIWETNGYDLNIVQYRTDKANGNPKDASYTAPLVAAADKFVGYSMGAGYWGKTFYCWPPDPRFSASANLTSPNSSKPGFDTSGNAMCDWRRHFFLNKSAALFDPQADNNPSTASPTLEGINAVLMNTGSGLTLSSTTANWQVNYPAVLKWIKAGPQTLPPNLRAGRVLYYSSIPDDVNTGTGTAQQVLDKVFWKRYIDYVVGITSTDSTALYGNGDSWSSGTVSIYTSNLNVWTGASGTWTSAKPYMRYNDNPTRPRLHMWFGPLSMMDFIGNSYQLANGGSWNWNPGTCHEAQCWQLKAGMSSVIDDVQANHPNHYVGMTMFAANGYNDMRVSMGQNYPALKNALFYPKSLLSVINTGDTTTEERPYTSSWGTVGQDEFPNANGSTDPNTGLAYAFNLLSPSASLPAEYTTTVGGQPVRGRRGAGKMVIFETDGVPNTYRGLTSGTQTMNPTLKGYDTYYPTSAWSSGNIGNGVEPCMSEAIKIVTQMVKPMAGTNGNGTDSGLSLPNAPCKVYSIGFGDIFDPVASPGATFRPTALQFLANIAATGGTGTAGATTIPSYQVITGTYANRITNLKTCMQQIFQAGVAVTLVQ